MWLTCNQSFHNDILDVCPNLLGGFVSWILAVFLDVIEDCPEAALVAYIILVRVFIENKVVTVLIECIIREVHAEVIQITSQWGIVFFGSETGKSLMVNIGTEGIHAGH